MSEVLSKISYDYKFVYFNCSHDREVHIGEQNHQNQKLSAGSDMDSQPDFYFFTFECPRQGEGGKGSRASDNVRSLSFFFKKCRPLQKLPNVKICMILAFSCLYKRVRLDLTPWVAGSSRRWGEWTSHSQQDKGRRLSQGKHFRKGVTPLGLQFQMFDPFFS